MAGRFKGLGPRAEGIRVEGLGVGCDEPHGEPRVHVEETDATLKPELRPTV